MANTEKPKKPTSPNLTRQKLLHSKMVADGGKTPIKKLMKESGYSDAYAKNPQKLKNTKGWSDLLNKYIPNTLAFRTHKKLLNSVEFVEKKGKRGVVKIVAQPTAQAAKALDMLYKMRGYYVPEEQKHSFSERVEEALERLAGVLPDPKV